MTLLERDAAGWLRACAGRIERDDLPITALPAALREFLDRLEAELPPPDMGPGIGGVALSWGYVRPSAVAP